jgi:hypothetical protein
VSCSAVAEVGRLRAQAPAPVTRQRVTPAQARPGPEELVPVVSVASALPLGAPRQEQAVQVVVQARVPEQRPRSRHSRAATLRRMRCLFHLSERQGTWSW